MGSSCPEMDLEFDAPKVRDGPRRRVAGEVHHVSSSVRKTLILL
jgi:hypothetical protein